MDSSNRDPSKEDAVPLLSAAPESTSSEGKIMPSIQIQGVDSTACVEAVYSKAELERLQILAWRLSIACMVAGMVFAL
jgi:hypothetical protein